MSFDCFLHPFKKFYAKTHQIFDRYTSEKDAFVLPLTREVCDACADIHEKSFARGWRGEEMHALITSEKNQSDGIFLAPDRLIGFIISRILPSEAEIITFALDPAFRQRGWGRYLLHTHLSRLRERGVAEIFLEVEEHNDIALALYRHMGFFQIGARKGYYPHAHHPPTTALVLKWQETGDK